MLFKDITYDVVDRIATVTLNRPEQMNALHDAMVSEIYDAMRAADEDPAVRVIILTGAGRAFCAGGDIGGFGGVEPKSLLNKLPRIFNLNRRADYQMRHIYFPQLRKPVIGMLNGATAGLGLIYALACDVRFAADAAVFTTAFAKRGLSAEYGMAWILARVVGHANALDLLLSARKVRGEEAAQLGLVNKMLPAADLKEHTYAYARELAQTCSPRSMRVIKEQLYEVPFQTLHEAVLMANRDMVVSNAGADFTEGTASFKEKRPPRFQNDEE